MAIDTVEAAPADDILGMGIKKLGFGLMRLPQVEPQAEGEKAAIDIEQTKQMVDLFLEAGFTYFDTAWAYEGSEDAIRQALVERHPRESYQLATKNAVWINCASREEAEARFDESLARTGAGTSTSTCCTTWARDARTSSTTTTSGTSCSARRPRGSSATWVSRSIPRPRSSTSC